MNKNQYETFETLGGTKKSSKYRCENCGFNKPIGENGTYCSKAAEISVIFNPEEDSNMFLGCASHSDFQKFKDKLHPYNPQAEQHWRDLFISDLRSIIIWDARNGNPELFKAVSTLDKQYESYSVEQHDLAIRQAEREKVLKKMLECISQYEMLPNGMDFVIEDLLAELRQAGE